MEKTDKLLMMLHSVDVGDRDMAVELIRGYKQNGIDESVIEELSNYFDDKVNNMNDLRYSKTLYKQDTYHLMQMAILLDQWKNKK